MRLVILTQLKPGETGKIRSVGGHGALRQHFLDMGVIPGSDIMMMQYAPMGDPIEFRLHGYELTMRVADAKQIEVDQIRSDGAGDISTTVEEAEFVHPGLGEPGRYHNKKDEKPLPSDKKLTFALVGNQNCGKTTLFNQLTGANQHVGNFPGVTVDRKDGPIRGHDDTLVTDLPGIYSMSPYTSEEIISRNFVLEQKPSAIINIIDATNIERNLYLTMQLLEMNKPMVIALNMMDEVTGNGGSIDINRMEIMLGVPVVPIAAVSNEGVDELVNHALHVARYQECPLPQDYCDEKDHEGAVHRCIHAVEHMIEDHAQRADIPLRFAASKLVEGDPLVMRKLKLDDNEVQTLEHIVAQMTKECGMDRSAAVADMRYDFIYRVCECTVTRSRKSREYVRSRKIDKFLTGKYTAIPAFVLIMLTIFLLTFNVIGKWLQELLSSGINGLCAAADTAMTNAGTNPMLHSLIVDGIFNGVGTVLSFLPIVLVLFLLLSFLEDSGYIARVAFFMDKLLRKIGLSGRSIVPLLIGFGCTVPAVMSTRTLPSARDRRMTVMLTPFMSCTAKMPVYAFFAAAFFPAVGGLITVGLYVFGILVGILAAMIYKRTVFRGEAVPFVMELPNYRLPSVRNVLQLLWEKAKDFLQRAFGVIMIASIVIWFLEHFGLSLNLVENPSDSILAAASGWMSPVFRPLGFGDWRICTSLITGVMAKESVVSSLNILFADGITGVLTRQAAASLLVFCLLYTPCVAALTSVRRELGHGWAVGIAVWHFIIAWIAAFAVRGIIMLFGG